MTDNVVRLRRRPFLERYLNLYRGYRRMNLTRWQAARAAWRIARL